MNANYQPENTTPRREPAQKRDHTGTLSLVLAILAPLFLTPVVAGIAILAGILGTIHNKGQRTAALYLSVIGTVLGSFVLIGWLLITGLT